MALTLAAATLLSVPVSAPAGASTVDVRSLKYPFKGQTRKLMCLSTTAMPRTTEVCATHIGLPFEIGTKKQASQIHEAYQRARADGHGVPLILGGDFNAVPTANALDAVYFSGGGGAHGAMQEVDACPGSVGGRKHHSASCNSPTHQGVKNDYVFVSHKSFKTLTGAPVDSKYSDHQALVCTMVECATGAC